jgi:hypothetical protein
MKIAIRPTTIERFAQAVQTQQNALVGSVCPRELRPIRQRQLAVAVDVLMRLQRAGHPASLPIEYDEWLTPTPTPLRPAATC